MEKNEKEAILAQFLQIKIKCSRHLEEVANFFCFDADSQVHGILCSVCLENDFKLLNQQKKTQLQSLKYLLSQIFEHWSQIVNSIPTSALLDHVRISIQKSASEHFPKETSEKIQESLKRYLMRFVDLLNGCFFEEIFVVAEWYVKQKDIDRVAKQIESEWMSRLTKYVLKYQQFLESMNAEQFTLLNLHRSGRAIISTIRSQVTTAHQEFSSIIQQMSKGSPQEEIFKLFSSTDLKTLKAYSFCDKMKGLHLILDSSKKISMPSSDSEFTQLALIEPPITGKKIRTLKLQMIRICGWVSVGVACKKKAEDHGYKFETANLGHGCFHVSYDGYSWSDTSKEKNELYTGWYFNEGDILTVEVDPSQSRISFAKNSDPVTASLDYECDKKDKLHFSVGLNYYEDCVEILES